MFTFALGTRGSSMFHFILRLRIPSIYFFFFFFLMIRRPPRSTLFPTRRSSDLIAAARAGGAGLPGGGLADQGHRRSEEHTSELQSHVNLVCRLLLEKKKKQK